MAFKLAAKPKEMRWKVEGHEPDDKKPGHYKAYHFFATFVFMGKAEFDQAKEECAGDDLALVRRIMTGWELQDESGKPFDFSSDDDVRAVLNVQHVNLAIIRSYVNFISGGATRGNL
jgi:hypothetical protein